MPLTRTDKEDIQLMFDSGINHIKEVEALKMQLINQKLDSIIEQTTKTNGTVKGHIEKIGLLEKQVIHSTDNCPQNNKINTLYDSFNADRSIKKWKVAALAMLGAIVGAIVSVIAVFEFILKYKP